MSYCHNICTVQFCEKNVEKEKKFDLWHKNSLGIEQKSRKVEQKSCFILIYVLSTFNRKGRCLLWQYGLSSFQKKILLTPGIWHCSANSLSMHLGGFSIISKQLVLSVKVMWENWISSWRYWKRYKNKNRLKDYLYSAAFPTEFQTNS